MKGVARLLLACMLLPAIHETEAQTAQSEQVTQATQPGFSRVTATHTQIQTAPNRSTFTTPDHYISRFDRTTVSTNYANTPCVNSPLSTCDTPVARIDFTNQQTGMIPNLIGLEISGWGFKSNTPSHDTREVGMPYLVGLGVQMQDANVPNLSNLRGANFVVNLSGLPTTLGSNGFTRSGVGIEVDVNPNVSADAVFPGMIGNELDGMSIVANGNKNSTAAIAVGSSATDAKGWLDGLAISGVVNCGICLYNGGTSGKLAPATGIHLATSGAYGLVVGAGTVNEAKSSASLSSDPAIGILLDARGSPGRIGFNDSNTLVFRTGDGPGRVHNFQWQAQQSSHALTLTIDGGEKIRFNSGETSFEDGSLAGYHDARRHRTWSISNATGAAVLGETTIGQGTPILRHLSGTSALDFGVLKGNTCSSVEMNVEGVSEGDTVALGMPTTIASKANLIFAGYVSAPGTVTVKVCNVAAASSVHVPRDTVRADVWQH
jgi:hypothetical protein